LITSDVKLYVLQNCLYQPGLYYEAGGQGLSASNHRKVPVIPV